MAYAVIFKKDRYTLSDFNNEVHKNIITSRENKKYGQTALYLSVIPMMAIGLAAVIIILFCMIFLL
jgi:hypothetical protein